MLSEDEDISRPNLSIIAILDLRTLDGICCVDDANSVEGGAD